MPKDHRDLGDRLGPRLAAVVAQAVVAARRQLAPHEARVQAAASQLVIDRAGLEIADLYRPVMEQITAGQDLPPWLTDHVAEASSGRHQWKAIGGFLLGSGLSSPISTALNNYLAPGIRDLVSLKPELVPDPGTLAALVAQGFLDLPTALSWGAGQGYSAGIMESLIAAATTFPSVGAVQDMLNRGLIAEPEAVTILGRQGYQADSGRLLAQLRRQLLSPADAALAALRGVVSQDQADAIAAASGMTAGDLAVLQGNTGEPPGTEALMEALRRGFIGADEFDRGIRQSRVRNEWIPVLTKLQYAPMSTADAVTATVQNYLTDAQGQAIAEQNGLEPEHWRPLREAAGEPLSRTEMTSLLNRGLVSTAEVEQALRESRLKDKYIPAALQLRVRLPEPREVITAVERGAATMDQALDNLLAYGYSHDTATMLLKSGLAARRGTHHHLAAATITQLYEDQLVDRDTALNMLTGTGWDPPDAEWILRLADMRFTAKLQAQAVAVIRQRYVTHRLALEDAQADLDAIDVPAGQRDQLLRLWGLERAMVTRQLTEAQVIAAVKKGLLDVEHAADRLTAMGYDTDDAWILLGLKPGTPLPSTGG